MFHLLAQSQPGPSIVVPVVGLLTGAALGVAGVCAGLWQSQKRIETDIRLNLQQHLAARELDELRHRHEKDLALRSGLHSDRVSAYREYSTALQEYLRADEELDGAHGAVQRIIDGISDGVLDEARAWRAKAIAVFEPATQRLKNALAMLELIASRPVADAARIERECAFEQARARLGLDRTPDAPSDPVALLQNIVNHTNAVENRRAAETNLWKAIRTELGVDTFEPESERFAAG